MCVFSTCARVLVRVWVHVGVGVRNGMWVQQCVSKLVEEDPDERRVALIALAKVAS